MQKKSIIWNLTRACPWHCEFCCVSAKYIKGFKKINPDKLHDASWENELSFIDKIKIINELSKGDYRVDFSGGDLLIDPVNLDVILHASEKLGKDNVGISISGAFVTDKVVQQLRGKINDVEITLDYVPYKYFKHRPVGYHEYNGNAMIKFKKAGFTVGAQTVITRSNIDKKKIYELFSWLEHHHIDEWSILRYFPTGRGDKFKDITPTYEEYCDIVDYIRQITTKSHIKPHFQYLLPNHEGYTLDCRALKKSIGILNDGTVIACFWALDDHMKPKDKDFILGKLPEDQLDDILRSPQATAFTQKNVTCKFFSKSILEDNKMLS